MEEWQDDFPKELGHWWFYGWPFGRWKEPELHLVEVAQASNSLIYLTSGFFLYESEAQGKWLKAVLPELPLLPL